MVLDPFAGSNTTGYVAEGLKRKWVGVELRNDYAQESRLRFEGLPEESGIAHGQQCLRFE
jgi:site-specific DNA-methyltransferase (cytosine-N4-specific)